MRGLSDGASDLIEGFQQMSSSARAFGRRPTGLMSLMIRQNAQLICPTSSPAVADLPRSTAALSFAIAIRP
ncbi:hypothetical protein HL667_27530 [Bradyrhizobium sp. 83012]|uniref:Uncharacterized protein n=1 Tax=Bradyrhizobium aeschynomenes TaxID=2734909 RepID=A0ABX2CKX1_9BRAD|nr:hypothetical protein [Bradyrhizobium aeschynomenes]NPU68783.1 hypothetical protein [Bradyrhizobium aeschynomenes]